MRVPLKFNVCARVHYGPICVNGGDRDQPICMHCGRDVTQEDRALTARIWLQAREIMEKANA